MFLFLSHNYQTVLCFNDKVRVQRRRGRREEEGSTGGGSGDEQRIRGKLRKRLKEEGRRVDGKERGKRRKTYFSPSMMQSCKFLLS